MNIETIGKDPSIDDKRIIIEFNRKLLFLYHANKVNSIDRKTLSAEYKKTLQTFESERSLKTTFDLFLKFTEEQLKNQRAQIDPELDKSAKILLITHHDMLDSSAK